MARIILLIGPMGCGKTTVGRLLAEKCGYPFADGDDFHPEENIVKMSASIPLTDTDRLPWLTLIRERIEEDLSNGRSLVLACSALKESYRRILGIDQKRIHSVYLKGSRSLLEQRIAGRTDHYMARDLLDSQLATLEEPETGTTVDIHLSPEQLVDQIIRTLQLKII